MKTVRSNRRRTALAMAIVIALVGVFVVRLVDIQVVRADALDRQASERRGMVSAVEGTRGSIVADDGTVLARTVLRYDIVASPENAKPFFRTVGSKSVTVSVSKAVSELASALGLTAAKVTDPIDAALALNKHSQYAVIAKGVDAGVYSTVRALGIPWIAGESHQVRVYPNGAVAGNILGFLNSSEKPQAGLEQAANTCLAGSDGEETYQMGEDGVTIPGSQKVATPAKDGGTLQTTLDPDLQWYAQQQLAQTVPALGGQFGMVTVASVKDAKIKVAAQWPSVDPNNLSGVDPAYRYRSMQFASQFEPGSTFKPLTAAALLEAGAATPASQVLASYNFSSGHGAVLHDSTYHDPERLTLTGVLMESSNTGMSQLGSRISDQSRYDLYKKFGIGSSTGIDFPSETDGTLTKPSTWDDQTKYATMFGQGVAASQLQMVSAYQALANGGVRVPLSITDGCKHADGSMTSVPDKSSERVVSTKTASTVLDMLESVVTTGELSSELQIPGYRIAAKTGTAQEGDGHGGYLPYYYVSVMGVVPVDDPQYVVSVNIGYPTTITTSAAAAPLFKTIMSQVLKAFRVGPSTSAPSSYPPFY